MTFPGMKIATSACVPLRTTSPTAGRHVYFVPYGASDALGAMGYALAAEEIVRDLPEIDWIVHASGSAGTQAGLLAGLIAMGHPARVIGVDVDAQAARVRADVCRVGREAAAILGCAGNWDDSRVEVIGHWSGPAYGVADATTEEAVRLAAQLEGLALDPVYSGKGMAGLIGLARDGRFAGGGSVYGSTPAEAQASSPTPRRWLALQNNCAQCSGAAYRIVKA